MTANTAQHQKDNKPQPAPQPAPEPSPQPSPQPTPDPSPDPFKGAEPPRTQFETLPVITIVNCEDSVRDMATHLATEKLNEQLRPVTPATSGLQAVSNFFKGLWYQATEEYQRLKLSTQVFDNMKQEFRDDSAARGIEGADIVERFSSGLHTIDASSTEEAKDFSAGDNRKGRQEILNLIAQFACDKTFTEAQFLTEKRSLLAELTRENKDVLNHADLNSDNLLKIAQDFRARTESNEAKREMINSLTLRLGKAKSAIKQEAHRSTLDKILYGRIPVGSPIVAALAIGYCVTAFGAKIGLSSGARLVGGIVAAAAFAATLSGLRKHNQVNKDRAHAARALAFGYDRAAAGSSKTRQAAVHQHIRQMASAHELTERLNQALTDLDNERDPSKRNERLQEVALASGEIRGRLTIGSTNHTDYISYDDPSSIEKQRLKLLRVVARAESELPSKVTSQQEWDFFAKAFNDRVGQLVLDLQAEDAKIEKNFKAFRRAETRKAFVEGLAAGALSGSITAAVHYGGHMLAEAFGANSAHAAVAATVASQPSGSLTGYTDMDGGAFKVMNGSYDANTHSLLSADGKTIYSGELVDAQGRALPAAKAAAEQANWTVTQVTPSAPPTETITQSVSVFEHSEIKAHTVTIDDRLHLDNNTKAFDRNELRLATVGTGVNAEGQYVYSVAQMTNSGSVHGELSVEAQKAFADGKMKAFISLDKDHQMTPIQLDVNKDGTIVIDPNSAIGKAAFKVVDGELQFQGKFFEVGTISDSTDAGLKVRILATELGTGSAPTEITTEIPGQPMPVRTETTFTAPAPSTPTLSPATTPESEFAPLAFPVATHRRKALEEHERTSLKPEPNAGDSGAPGPKEDIGPEGPFPEPPKHENELRNERLAHVASIMGANFLGPEQWQEGFGVDVGEVPPLPTSLTDELLQSACPLHPEQQIKDTHLLVLMPKTVNGEDYTALKLDEMCDNLRGSGDRLIKDQEEWANSWKSANWAQTPQVASAWALIPKLDPEPDQENVDEGTHFRNKKVAEQEEVHESHYAAYRQAKAIEVMTAALLHVVVHGQPRMLGGRGYKGWLPSLRCLGDDGSGDQVCVGDFSANGLEVIVGRNDYASYGIGRALARKLQP